MSNRPSPYHLWQQAEENPARYTDLMISHGYLVREGKMREPSAIQEVLADVRLSKVELKQVNGNHYTVVDHETGTVSTGFVCGHGRAPKKCKFCKTRFGEFACDYPLGTKCKACKGTGTEYVESHFKTYSKPEPCDKCEGTGKATCSKLICSLCRRSKDGGDYCPDHRERAGIVEKIKREPCQWIALPCELKNPKCLHNGCVEELSQGDRALFFPRRARAMCVPCGQSYMLISEYQGGRNQ
jgi:hypothetical protein